MAGWLSHIGAYRIVRKLGEGGMGAVFVGEHRLLGSQVAIKVLLPSLSADAEIVKRFFHEARAVTRIADPGLVQVFDFGRHKNGSAYLVMELLHGEPMDRRLRHIGRFTARACLRLMVQICTSLDIVHAHGIVHRDLKPENLFLAFDPAMPGGERAKILDFGIAKLSDDAPSKPAHRVMGTPYYMSPEQCSGDIEIDQRSDVYAMGCVMFKMLTGHLPFDGQAPIAIIAHHLRSPAPRVSSRVADVPPALDAIVARCLCKDARDRFPSMAALVGALLAAEHTLPASPARTDPPVLGPAWDFTDVAVRRRPARMTTLHGASGEASALYVEPQVEAPARLSWSWRAGIGAVLLALSLVVFRGGDAASTAGSTNAPIGPPIGTPIETPIEPAAAPRLVEPASPPPPPLAIPIPIDAGVTSQPAVPVVCLPAPR